jgi:hypothetical protein
MHTSITSGGAHLHLVHHPEVAAELEPRDAWEHDVEQDQIRRPLADVLQQRVPVGQIVDLVPFVEQESAQHPSTIVVVVDDEDSPRLLGRRGDTLHERVETRSARGALA